MWEGHALPHDTTFRNCRGKNVDSRVFPSWSLIHGSSWSGFIKVKPGHQQDWWWLRNDGILFLHWRAISGSASYHHRDEVFSLFKIHAFNQSIYSVQLHQLERWPHNDVLWFTTDVGLILSNQEINGKCKICFHYSRQFTSLRMRPLITNQCIF